MKILKVRSNNSPGDKEKELKTLEEDIQELIVKSSDEGQKRKRETCIEKRRKKDGDIKFRYIGETHRSAYERGKEHLRDLMDLNEGSHFLKH